MKALIGFLKANVNGRTLHTSALEGVYTGQIAFSNLQYSQTGLRLDMFIVSKEKIYVCEAGKRGPLRKDFSGVSLFRYELAKRRSTHLSFGGGVCTGPACCACGRNTGRVRRDRAWDAALCGAPRRGNAGRCPDPLKGPVP